MRSAAFTILFILVLVSASFAAGAGGTALFSDSFQGTQLSPEWEIHEGNWQVADGSLMVTDGGIISLKNLPGACFEMEFEMAFPANWMSIIPLFTGPDDYATLYIGGGYWESFQMIGTDIADFVQHPDPEIARTGGFQKIKVISQYGNVRFVYDGKPKGPAAFPFRPGARIGFRSLPGSGVVKIRNFRLASIESPAAKVVADLPAKDLAQGAIWKDLGIEGKPGATSDPLNIEAKTGAVALAYAFAADKQFESGFVRIPVSVKPCGRIFMEAEGDDSQNSFFVIVHDASGEQHLVMKSGLTWNGWQEVGIDLSPLVKGPVPMQRLAIHWGGDQNQRIDFPITAMDIGITKRSPSQKSSGQLRFRNIRFVE